MDNVSHLQAIHNIVYSQLGLMSLDGKDLHLEENDPRRKKNCNIWAQLDYFRRDNVMDKCGKKKFPCAIHVAQQK